MVEGRVGDPDPRGLALLAQCDHLGELVLERNGSDPVRKLVVGQPAQVHRPQLLHAEGRVQPAMLTRASAMNLGAGS